MIDGIHPQDDLLRLGVVRNSGMIAVEGKHGDVPVVIIDLDDDINGRREANVIDGGIVSCIDNKVVGGNTLVCANALRGIDLACRNVDGEGKRDRSCIGLQLVVSGLVGIILVCGCQLDHYIPNRNVFTHGDIVG